MYHYKPLTEEQALAYARLQLNAYPAIGYNRSPEQYAESLLESNNRDQVNEYCMYEDNELVAGFNVWDFDMNVRGIITKAAGIGSVAVDLCRKKEKIALHLMRHFIHSQRERGRNMTLLYAFNSSFYHKMGYGFGTLLQQYRIRPSDLPSTTTKEHIVLLREEDATMWSKYYNKKVGSTHGLIHKSEQEFITRLKNAAVKIFAYQKDGVIEGYLACTFKKGNEESFLVNDLVVNELFFDSPDVFLELMTFLKSQSDQVRYVMMNSLDEGLLHTFTDPRNHTERILFSVYQEVCRTGLGIMYRISDVMGFFDEIHGCRFGDVTMTVKLLVRDTIVEENNRSFLLTFADGICDIKYTDQSVLDVSQQYERDTQYYDQSEVDVSQQAEYDNDQSDVDVSQQYEHDVELCIDIAELSSLLMGCANLKQLVKYGKAQVSDLNKLDVLSRALYLDEKPMCVTHF